LSSSSRSLSSLSSATLRAAVLVASLQLLGDQGLPSLRDHLRAFHRSELPTMTSKQLSSSAFYSEYHGHTIEHLDALHEHLPEGRGVVYLVGDSTLDNKYWLGRATHTATNGYERILTPPKAVPDVAHHLNAELVRRGRGDKLVCINTAIEESTLGLRHNGKLLPQDAWVRSHIAEPDVLIVSCGGNDIALRPTVMTGLSMATLLAMPKGLIACGPWMAPGLAHFTSLFRDATRRYVESLIGVHKPRVVVVCMLYYLDVQPGGSWADNVLRLLGYDKDPEKLQICMRKIFEYATTQIKIDGVQVVPVPLYEALDGTISADYAQRVEPSAQGGLKMANLILDRLLPVYENVGAAPGGGAAAGRARRSPRGAGAGDDVVAMPKAVHAENE